MVDANDAYRRKEALLWGERFAGAGIRSAMTSSTSMPERRGLLGLCRLFMSSRTVRTPSAARQAAASPESRASGGSPRCWLASRADRSAARVGHRSVG